MTDSDAMDLVRTLEDIDLQMRNGIDALLVIAQTLDSTEDDRPEGPACYFVAEGLSAQRLKLMKCIDAAIEAHKLWRPDAGPTLVS